MHTESELVYGTCVALGRRAALLRGPPGSGKSDLALRFLFLARRGPAAVDPPGLVADDQVRVTREAERVLVAAPDSILGKIEVRGIGIVGAKPVVGAELVVVVDLVDAAQVERLPDASETVCILGLDLPVLRLTPFEASSPIKLALALARSGQA